MLPTVFSSHFRHVSSFAIALLLCAAAQAADPVYQNDFEKAEVGKTPEGFTIMGGSFSVRQEGGNKFLELAELNVDAYGFLFGPALDGNGAASARFYGTKQGRKFPAFGLSLNGAGGYRLQVSPAKKALEIYKGDESKVTVPFEWTSGAWTRVKIQTHKDGAHWIAEGKAWTDGSPEPAAWMIKFEDPEDSAPGRAGAWGTPFAGTPIRFDDLRLEKIP